MKVWITRDSDFDGDICGWKSNKGLFRSDGYWDSKGPMEDNRTIDLLDCISPRNFKSLFGFTPRKGTCKQYKLSLKETT
jgi:hypothetical protein